MKTTTIERITDDERLQATAKLPLAQRAFDPFKDPAYAELDAKIALLPEDGHEPVQLRREPGEIWELGYWDEIKRNGLQLSLIHI